MASLMKPDPSFYPSPRMAMKAAPETLAYVAAFDPDRKVPDAIAVVCTLIVLTALRSPVTGAVSRYTAAFSDVSGLYVGDDVRISGVQVGKVESIRLDGRIAKVDFTAQVDHPVFARDDYYYSVPNNLQRTGHLDGAVRQRAKFAVRPHSLL